MVRGQVGTGSGGQEGQVGRGQVGRRVRWVRWAGVRWAPGLTLTHLVLFYSLGL